MGGYMKGVTQTGWLRAGKKSIVQCRMRPPVPSQPGTPGSRINIAHGQSLAATGIDFVGKLFSYYTRFTAQCPYLIIATVFSTLLLVPILYTVIWPPVLSTSAQSYRVHDNSMGLRQDTLEAILDTHQEADMGDTRLRNWDLQVSFGWSSKNSDNSTVLNPEALGIMREIEHEITGHHQYGEFCKMVTGGDRRGKEHGRGGTRHCVPPISVLNYYFPTLQEEDTYKYWLYDGKGRSLSEEDIHATTALLTTQTEMRWALAKEFSQTHLMSHVARSKFTFEVQTRGKHTHEDFMRFLQDVERNLLQATSSRVYLAYHSNALMETWVERSLVADYSLIATVVGFVTLWVFAYTKSPCWGIMTVLLILFAIPLTYWVYSAVFRVTYFGILHLLSLVLIFGMGSFWSLVLFEVWNTSDSLDPLGDGSGTPERLRWTLKKTWGSLGPPAIIVIGLMVLLVVIPIDSVRYFGIWSALLCAFMSLVFASMGPPTLVLYESGLPCFPSCGVFLTKVRQCLDGSGGGDDVESISDGGFSDISISNAFSEEATDRNTPYQGGSVSVVKDEEEKRLSTVDENSISYRGGWPMKVRRSLDSNLDGSLVAPSRRLGPLEGLMFGVVVPIVQRCRFVLSSIGVVLLITGCAMVIGIEPSGTAPSVLSSSHPSSRYRQLARTEFSSADASLEPKTNFGDKLPEMKKKRDEVKRSGIVCKAGFFGEYCERRANRLINGCNVGCGGEGRGICSNSRICDCKLGYAGVACQDTCSTTGDMVCHGSGICWGSGSGTAHCECTEGHRGMDCEIQCPRGPFGICNSRGVCSMQGTCVCSEPWTGIVCDARCPTYPVDFPQECSGHGHCVSTGCECAVGWNGDGCQYKCPSWNSKACGEWGTCDTLAKECKCEPPKPLAGLVSGVGCDIVGDRGRLNLLPPQTGSPPPLHYPAMVYAKKQGSPQDDYLIVYGGRTRENKAHGKVYQFSIREWNWSEIIAQDSDVQLGDRYGHCMVNDNTRIFVFGGMDWPRLMAKPKTLVIDRSGFTVADVEWTLESDGDGTNIGPSPRVHHACASLSSGIFVFGGESRAKEPILDAWKIVAVAGNTYRAQRLGSIPHPITGIPALKHPHPRHEEQLYFFGSSPEAPEQGWLKFKLVNDRAVWTEHNFDVGNDSASAEFESVTTGYCGFSYSHDSFIIVGGKDRAHRVQRIDINGKITALPILRQPFVMGSCVGFYDRAGLIVGGSDRRELEPSIAWAMYNPPICPGYASEGEDALPCGGNGRGSCDITSGECICITGFTGEACELDCPVGDNGLPCSGEQHGTCTRGGQCVCSEGRSGTACELLCPQANGQVCAGHGSCWSSGNNVGCFCQVGWSGFVCDHRCPMGDEKVCSGRGSCNNDGFCECDEGWAGAACDQKCPHSAQGEVCSGHGNCAQDASCHCDHGYSGHDCSLFTCASSSMCSFPNGDCDPLGLCVCHDGFFGDTCSSSDLCGNECSNRGSCMAEGCVCDGPFGGERCTQRWCYNELAVSHGTCICKDGWEGSDCTIEAACPNGCSRHGECIDGVCHCHNGWTGRGCEDESDGRSHLPETEFAPVSVLFGLRPWRAVGDDKNVESFIDFDIGFNLANPLAQRYIYDFCVKVAARRSMVRHGEVLSCIMEDFHDYVVFTQRRTFPIIEEEFDEAFQDFLNQYQGEIASVLGMDSAGRIEWLRVVFRANVLHNEHGNAARQAYNDWEAMLEAEKDTAPSCAVPTYHTSTLWVRVATESHIMPSVTVYAVLALMLAGCVSLLVTGNCYICTVLVFMWTCSVVVSLGWVNLLSESGLGSLEIATCAVHMAWSVGHVMVFLYFYSQSDSETRAQKTADSILAGGPAIFSSMLCMVLFTALLSMFSDIAGVVEASVLLLCSMTSSAATIFALMVPTMVMCGPQGQAASNWIVLVLKRALLGSGSTTGAELLCQSPHGMEDGVEFEILGETHSFGLDYLTAPSRKRSVDSCTSDEVLRGPLAVGPNNNRAESAPSPELLEYIGDNPHPQ